MANSKKRITSETKQLRAGAAAALRALRAMERKVLKTEWYGPDVELPAVRAMVAKAGEVDPFVRGFLIPLAELAVREITRVGATDFSTWVPYVLMDKRKVEAERLELRADLARVDEVPSAT